MEPIYNHINPYFEMLIGIKPERFFGRVSVVSRIIQGVSAKSPRSFSVRGNRTIGKTTLLKYLCSEENAVMSIYGQYTIDFGPHRNGKLKFVYVDLEEMEDIGEPIHYLYEKISKSLLQEHIINTGVNNNKKPEEALHKMFRYFQEQNMRLVICLDHFDNVFKSMDNNDEYILRHLCMHQSIITSTEKNFLDLRKSQNRISSPLVPLLEGIHIGLLTKPEARKLIENPAANVKKPFSPDQVDFILKMVGGQPYLLTIACSVVFDALYENADINNVEEIEIPKKGKEQLKISILSSSTFSGLFNTFLTQLQENEYRTLCKIAEGNDPDLSTEIQAINVLKYKSLIYEDLMKGKYNLFSELFREYVLMTKKTHTINGFNAAEMDFKKISKDMSPIDRKLFEYLMSKKGNVCRFDELLKEVWDDPKASKRGLEAAVNRVRNKLKETADADANYIRNVRGEGFVFEPKN